MRRRRRRMDRQVKQESRQVGGSIQAGIRQVAGIRTYKRTDRKTESQTGRKAGRKTDTQTEGQADRQTLKFYQY